MKGTDWLAAHPIFRWTGDAYMKLRYDESYVDTFVLFGTVFMWNVDVWTLRFYQTVRMISFLLVVQCVVFRFILMNGWYVSTNC